MTAKWLAALNHETFLFYRSQPFPVRQEKWRETAVRHAAAPDKLYLTDLNLQLASKLRHIHILQQINLFRGVIPHEEY